MSQYGQIFSYETMNEASFLRQHFPMQGNISSSTPQSSSRFFYHISIHLNHLAVFYDQYVYQQSILLLDNYKPSAINKTVNITAIFHLFSFSDFLLLFSLKIVANYLILC